MRTGVKNVADLRKTISLRHSRFSLGRDRTPEFSTEFGNNACKVGKEKKNKTCYQRLTQKLKDRKILKVMGSILVWRLVFVPADRKSTSSLIPCLSCH